MSSYYNDIDPYCCKVLRKNIQLGHLPGGTVDERDIRDIRADELVGFQHIHLFAGIGGFPLGLKWASFPDSIRVLTGGFPCFTAGTMVLTEAGFKSIETLVIGDKVLTHTGRWRPITSVMQRYAETTRIIRGQGFPDIRTTDEHPFYARKCGKQWENDIRQYRRDFSEPEWTPAEHLSNTTFVGQVLPIESINDEHSPDFWWIVGRYLADGWRVVANGKGRVVICAAKYEAEYVEERIKRVFHCTPSHERTVIKFHISRTEFHQFLEQFGKGAKGKTIPGWVLSLSTSQAEALLDGYLTGDGSPYRNNGGERGGVKATTISRSLALGIALLAQHVYGVVASIHEADVPEQVDIEGRTVSQQKQYQVVIPDRNRSAFVDGRYGWKLIRSNTLAGASTVYNISVEDDESYVADGVIVHNCQDISVAGKRAGITGERSGLWSEMYRVICELRPRFVLVENVSALLERGISRVLGDLARIRYDAEWQVLRASDFGLPHKRERVFIVAYPASTRLERIFQPIFYPSLAIQTVRQFRPTASDVLRKNHGISSYVDRLRGLGNAVVPQIAEYIGHCIMTSIKASEAVA